MVTRNTLAALAALFVGSIAPAMAQSGASKTQAFEVNGIHVIMCPAYNQIVSVVVGLEGGFASNETTNPALADFTADIVTSSGTTKFSQDMIRRITSETSTNLTGNGDYRGVTFNLTTTRPNFDRVWDVFASMINGPQYDEQEFKNQMQRRVVDIKRRWANPEAYASIISDSLVKLGNPVLGRTIQQSDVEAVTVAAMRDYMKRISERSRMLVVVVGNVSADEVKAKLGQFASLPMGAYKRPPLPPVPSAPAPKTELVDRQSPTTYVISSFAGPRITEQDYWPLQVGLSHLRNVLFEELRTKRNLTYAPGAQLSSTLGQSRGSVSVSSTLPDSCIPIMYNELRRMKQGNFDESDLNDSKQVFITAYYMRQMTNDGTANAIYAAERNAGDWHLAYSFDAINAVNKAAVKAAFAKYAKNLQVGIVGKKSGVTEPKYIFTE
ncbi:MAG TPA: insulinase family protein [Candidatus Kapabacteria bacterium]|nr:insulinase family protein [Candidatus Kapabacteria bacterium]